MVIEGNTMSAKGVLKLRINEGESIYVGDTEIKLEEISASGYSASLIVFADKSIPVYRSKALEKKRED
jgi:hypothetical protein